MKDKRDNKDLNILKSNNSSNTSDWMNFELENNIDDKPAEQVQYVAPEKFVPSLLKRSYSQKKPRNQNPARPVAAVVGESRSSSLNSLVTTKCCPTKLYSPHSYHGNNNKGQGSGKSRSSSPSKSNKNKPQSSPANNEKKKSKSPERAKKKTEQQKPNKLTSPELQPSSESFMRHPSSKVKRSRSVTRSQSSHERRHNRRSRTMSGDRRRVHVHEQDDVGRQEK